MGIFIIGNLSIMLILFFESTIFRWLKPKLDMSLDQKFDKMEAISDDYYSIISLKFLLSEYERTKQEKQKYLQYID